MTSDFTPSPGWATTVHVTNDGSHVALRNNRLLVIRDGEVRCSVPLMRVGRVVLTGSVNVSGKALSALLGRGVPLILLRANGKALGRLEPAGSGDANDRLRQLRAASSDSQRLVIARAIVEGKIANQRVLLARRWRRHSGGQPTGRAPQAPLSALTDLGQAAQQARSVDEVLGYEGAATAAYLRAWRQMLDPAYGFHGRDRRAADVVNALLNYSAALLREQVLTAIVANGLDPQISFLHTPFRGRPTLAFDLMEEWRPVLVESGVLSLVQLGAVTPADLIAGDEGRPLLSAEARRRTVERFHQRLATTFRPVASASALSFAQWIDHQVVAFKASLRSPATTYIPFRWR